MNELIKQVEKWSMDNGLHQSEPSKQFLKCCEELGETASALARGDRDKLKDGIGDVVVTLIILAQQNNLTLHECLDMAYREIADRKGKTVNGTFIKDSDFKFQCVRCKALALKEELCDDCVYELNN